MNPNKREEDVAEAKKSEQRISF